MRFTAVVFMAIIAVSFAMPSDRQKRDGETSGANPASSNPFAQYTSGLSNFNMPQGVGNLPQGFDPSQFQSYFQQGASNLPIGGSSSTRSKRDGETAGANPASSNPFAQYTSGLSNFNMPQGVGNLPQGFDPSQFQSYFQQGASNLPIGGSSSTRSKRDGETSGANPASSNPFAQYTSGFSNFNMPQGVGNLPQGFDPSQFQSYFQQGASNLPIGGSSA